MTKERQRFKDASEQGFGAGKDWAPMAFNFSEQEYAQLKVNHPELFDAGLHPRDRAQRWKLFADTLEGQFYRVR